LLRDPAKEYPQFEGALCLMTVLPPDEAVTLLRHRALQLSGKVWQMEAQLAELAQQDISALTGSQELLTPLARQPPRLPSIPRCRCWSVRSSRVLRLRWAGSGEICMHDYPSVTLTGQWSLPKISGWISATCTFAFKGADTRK